jgi:tRNA(adenine34) deaminase
VNASDEFYMAMALREAEKAASDGEVPTGCVIVDAEERILGRAHNRTEGLNDATAHAEMLALSAAFSAKGNWRLNGCRLYVTKEPCPMCAGAIILSRVDKVVWGVGDPKRGGASVFGIFDHPGINHHPEMVGGVMEQPCKAVLQEFFRKRRQEHV